MKKGFENIKALLATHSTEFETLEHEVCFTSHSYNKNMTIAREIISKLRETLIEKVDVMVKAIDALGGSIRQIVVDINQTTEIFINTDRSLHPNVFAWVQWFNTYWMTFL